MSIKSAICAVCGQTFLEPNGKRDKDLGPVCGECQNFVNVADFLVARADLPSMTEVQKKLILQSGRGFDL